MTMPDAPPPGVSVCDCGYDLTGLPRGADALCPECGVALRSLKPRKPWFVHGWIASVAFFLPAMVLIGAMVVGSLLPGSFVGDLSVMALVLLGGGLFWFVSVPACYLLIADRSEAKGFFNRLMIAVSVVLLLGMGNGLVLAVITAMRNSF